MVYACILSRDIRKLASCDWTVQLKNQWIGRWPVEISKCLSCSIMIKAYLTKLFEVEINMTELQKHTKTSSIGSILISIAKISLFLLCCSFRLNTRQQKIRKKIQGQLSITVLYEWNIYYCGVSDHYFYATKTSLTSLFHNTCLLASGCLGNCFFSVWCVLGH